MAGEASVAVEGDPESARREEAEEADGSRGGMVRRLKQAKVVASVEELEERYGK